MSTQRGNVTRTRGTKYANTYKFVHNKNSKKTKQILSSPIEGVCEKCYKILQWKKDYRKYKPLTVPRKCDMCHERKITRSYTHVCESCATKNGICAKCREKKPIVQDFDAAKKELKEQQEKERILSQLTERDRRRYLLHLERGDFDNDGESDGEGEEESDGEGESESDSDGEVQLEEEERRGRQTRANPSKNSPSTSRTPPPRVQSIQKSQNASKENDPKGAKREKIEPEGPDAPDIRPSIKSKRIDEDEETSGNCCAFDKDYVDDNSDADDDGDDIEDESDDDIDDSYHDDSDEEEKVVREPQIADPSNPIPGRKIFRAKRTTASAEPIATADPEALPDSDEELEEINKSFNQPDDDDDDPFLAALKTAEEKKKALASVSPTPVDISTKYNPKPSSLYETRTSDDVDELEEEMRAKLRLKEKKDGGAGESEDEEDDGPVKSFVFKALQ